MECPSYSCKFVQLFLVTQSFVAFLKKEETYYLNWTVDSYITPNLHGFINQPIILDFSKAFHRVSHEPLLRKLDHYSIRGSTHNWIKGFLTDRTQQVLVEGAASENIPVISGVPQGTVLGPLLFLLFINDLPDWVQSSTVFSTEESGTNMTVPYCKMTSIS